MIEKVRIVKVTFNRLFKRLGRKNATPTDANIASASPPEHVDVRNIGFPLTPDDYHLQHVGRTTQGNGYWITPQLVIEDDGPRDFIAAYIFDKKGNLISCDIVDLGLRSQSHQLESEKTIQRLTQKIDAKQPAEIWVKPFSVSFYGHTFGLIARDKDGSGEVVIDAMPGWTLMFHSPLDRCNYAS